MRNPSRPKPGKRTRRSVLQQLTSSRNSKSHCWHDGALLLSLPAERVQAKSRAVRAGGVHSQRPLQNLRTGRKSPVHRHVLLLWERSPQAHQRLRFAACDSTNSQWPKVTWFKRTAFHLQVSTLLATTVISSAGSTPPASVSSPPTTTLRTCGMQDVRLVRRTLIVRWSQSSPGVGTRFDSWVLLSGSGNFYMWAWPGGDRWSVFFWLIGEKLLNIGEFLFPWEKKYIMACVGTTKNEQKHCNIFLCSLTIFSSDWNDEISWLANQ